MLSVSLKTAVALKWLGIWLMFTAALMLYGETAPAVAVPDYASVVLTFGCGLFIFCFGCIRARRRYGAPDPG